MSSEPANSDERVNLRLSADDERTLEFLARRRHTTVNQAAHDLIARALDRWRYSAVPVPQKREAEIRGQFPRAVLDRSYVVYERGFTFCTVVVTAEKGAFRYQVTGGRSDGTDGYVREWLALMQANPELHDTLAEYLNVRTLGLDESA